MGKIKGTRAERELVHMLWNSDFAALRAAGSGSTPLPCPDVIAGNGIRKLAIECKSLKDKAEYIKKEKVEELIHFAKKFGAEPWIAIRFDNEGWFFLNHEDIERSKEGSYIIPLELAREKGLKFKELIEKVY